MSQSSLTPLPTLQKTLADLKAAHPHYDPPRLHGAEQLLARAEQQRPAVQAPLLRRAAALLNDYQQACENSGDGESRLATIVSTRRQQLAQRRSGAASALRALQRELNSETVTPSESAESTSPISALLRQQELSLLGGMDDSNAESRSSEPPRELRALRLLRSRQRHQDIEQRIDQAIQNAPEDPGPLNPQMLAIRALSNMRERSPAYLKQFVGYLDTLMWLDAQSQGDDSGKTKARKQSRRKAR